MLRIIGGWDRRPETVKSCAARLLTSLRLMPRHERYGPWGTWQPSHDSDYDHLRPARLATIDEAVMTIAPRRHAAVNRPPGQHLHLARQVVASSPAAEPHFLEYTARAGFVGAADPTNHLLFHAEDRSRPSDLFGCMSALVRAWEPDHLGLATRGVQREQGHRPPQAVVGFLTYVRAGIPFNRSLIDETVDVGNADRGLYIRVPGTPTDPSPEHIRQVRRALGYSTPAV